jgi:nitrite reductase (NADH) large subunit
MYRYVIVGAGVAGISAIEAMRRVDIRSEIIQVTDDREGYYSRPGLAYYLNGEISRDSLFPMCEADFRRLKVSRETGTVKRVIPSQHQIEIDNGRVLSYDKLLLATGATALAAKVPGMELEGVVKLDTLQDARQIIKLAHKRRSAVVIGGGITALEIAEGLRGRGLTVHYFLRGERYWSTVLDDIESRIVENRLKEEGIQIHYQTEVGQILSAGQKVVGVATTDGKEIDCDMVGVAVGIRARKSLAETAGLRTGRGIIVDEYLRTSDADIFAAGDVAEVYDPAAGKFILDSLWGPARKQGTAAGLNMAGKATRYSKGVPFNVTRLAGLTTTIIGAIGGREADADIAGIVRGDSEGWRQMPDALVAQSNFEINRLRVVVGEHHLVGALIMGDQTLSRAIHELVIKQIDISPIREKLLRPGQRINDVIADFWAGLNSTQGMMSHATV